MRARLQSRYHEALEPRVVLTLDKLSAAIKNVALFFRRQAGMRIPPTNMPLICLRCIKELALPLPVYATVVTLKEMARCEMRYEDWDEGSVTKVTQLSFPAAQLAALLVVAAKLLYPFDDVVRRPLAADEPGAMAVDWEAWMKVVQGSSREEKRRAKKSMTYARAMKVDEGEAINMTQAELDQYMEWYATNWTSDEIDARGREAEFRKDLLTMFPAPKTSSTPEAPDIDNMEQDSVKRIRAVMGSMKPREPASAGESVSRPGEYYTRWRSEEDLDQYSRSLCEEVGKVVGVSMARLIRAVFYVEGRLIKWSSEAGTHERSTGQASRE